MSEPASDNPGVIAFAPALHAITLVIGVSISLLFPVPLLPRPVAPSKPATAIVSTGAFRWSRNPVYLSLTLLYIAVCLLFDALWAWLLLPPLLVLMQIGVIEREEAYLDRTFGTDYLRYKARVRRWL